MRNPFVLFLVLLLIGVAATIVATLATGSLSIGQVFGPAAVLVTGYWLDRRYNGSSNSQSR